MPLDVNDHEYKKFTSDSKVRIADSDYAVRIDDTTTSDVVYVGIAPIATSTGADDWQVYKIDISAGAIITWADGDDEFNNIWDDRASLSYS